MPQSQLKLNKKCSFLLIKPSSMIFCDKPAGKTDLHFLQELVGGQLEGVQTSVQNHELFCMEECMIRMLSFNDRVNLFYDYKTLIRVSGFTGPFGNHVLYKKDGIRVDRLLEACKLFAFQEQDDDSEFYQDFVREAVRNYNDSQ